MYFPQNQCALNTLLISSIGTFFVSGSKKKTKRVIMTTNPAKKKKRPNFKWQSNDRKTWPMKKVKSMLTETLMDWPADLISMGKISLGTSHPNGPHDHAKAATYKHMRIKAAFPMPLEKDPWPVTPNTLAIMAPTVIYTHKTNVKIFFQ